MAAKRAETGCQAHGADDVREYKKQGTKTAAADCVGVHLRGNPLSLCQEIFPASTEDLRCHFDRRTVGIGNEILDVPFGYGRGWPAIEPQLRRYQNHRDARGEHDRSRATRTGQEAYPNSGNERDAQRPNENRDTADTSRCERLPP